MALLTALALAGLKFFPELVSTRGVFTSALSGMLAGLPEAFVWVGAVVLGLVLGAWWCGLAQYCVQMVQQAWLMFLPLDEDPGGWSWWRRFVLPMPIAELRQTQSSMTKRSEFDDLHERDRPGAYRSFLRAVIKEPLATLNGSGLDIAEGVRALADARLAAGLLIWLPLDMCLLSQHVLPGHTGLVLMLQVGAGVAFVSLGIATWTLSRRSLGVFARHGATQEVLGSHARLAVDSGMSRKQVREATDSTR